MGNSGGGGSSVSSSESHQTERSSFLERCEKSARDYGQTIGYHDALTKTTAESVDYVSCALIPSGAQGYKEGYEQGVCDRAVMAQNRKESTSVTSTLLESLDLVDTLRVL